MIKVSVVVPVYNVENYIDKCMASLVSQTLKEIEIIVVDDGSKDKSIDTVQKYVDLYPDIVKLYHKENGGLSDARNFGLPFCSGEYIGFVDSDDYVEPDMYEQMYNAAKSGNFDIVVCDYIKEYVRRSEVVKARAFHSKKEIFTEMLAAAWNKIYKREVIINGDFRFPKGVIYEDTEFFCKLIPSISGIGYVNKAFVHYVQRSGSIANSQGKKTTQIITILDDIVDYYKTINQYENYKDELELLYAKIILGSSMERMSRISDSPLRNEVLRQAYQSLNSAFPKWRKNRYINASNTKRNIYMRSVTAHNICLFGALLHVYFAYKDKMLY